MDRPHSDSPRTGNDLTTMTDFNKLPFAFRVCPLLQIPTSSLSDLKKSLQGKELHSLSVSLNLYYHSEFLELVISGLNSKITIKENISARVHAVKIFIRSTPAGLELETKEEFY